MNEKEILLIQKTADAIRVRVLEHIINENGGYFSQACSAAEILAALYLKIMNLGPVPEPLMPKPFPGVPGPTNQNYFTGGVFNGTQSREFDRFILSPAHYALPLYATLVEVGRMHPQGLAQFNKDGSSVEMIGAEHSPGMEVTAGSLGQAISQAAGIAMVRKARGDKGKVWLFMSDGEFQEGQNWEALQVINHYRLDNITIYVDVNGYQCDGKMDSVMNIEPFDKKLEAFGMRVFRIDGHNIKALVAYGKVPSEGRATVILCDTCPWRGCQLFKTREPKFHYLRFTSEEEKESYRQVLLKMKQEVV